MKTLGKTTLVTLALLLTFASPALAAPPTYISAVGDAFVCEDATYTVISGGLRVREDFHPNANGGGSVVFHLTAAGLTATDAAGASYRIVGVATDVVHYSPQGAITGEQFIVRMRILAAEGGVAGVAHLQMHVDRDGDLRFTGSGTCTPPNTV